MIPTYVVTEDVTLSKLSNTKQSEHSSKTVAHRWVLNFAGCTLEMLLEKVAANLVIKLQGIWRKHPEEFPGGRVDILVKDYMGTVRVAQVPLTPAGIKAQFDAMPKGEKKEAFKATILELMSVAPKK